MLFHALIIDCILISNKRLELLCLAFSRWYCFRSFSRGVLTGLYFPIKHASDYVEVNQMVHFASVHCLSKQHHFREGACWKTI